jgi:crotonobetainyl-CoA:carnitine CoA-transferase CaiB-like acyl-CoA transferase
VEPVLTPEEAARDAQAQPLLVDQPDGDGGTLRTVSPFAASGLTLAPLRPSPGPGQHTDEVLAELAS